MIDFRITLTDYIEEVTHLAHRDAAALRVGEPNPYEGCPYIYLIT